MKNEDIKYKLSTDYETLYETLNRGDTVVGFMEWSDLVGKPNGTSSKVCGFRITGSYFELGSLVLLKKEYSIERFAEYCKEWNVRYFPLEQDTSNVNVERVVFNIPDWADDVGLYTDKEGIVKVRYFKGVTPYYIDLPKCKKVNLVSVTKKYNNDRTGYNKNRKVGIDCYFYNNE